MKTITEFLSTKVAQTKIKATNETIHQIVRDEVDRLGIVCDLNHIDTSEVTSMRGLFYSAPWDLELSNKINLSGLLCDKMHGYDSFKEFNGDISKWNVSKVEDMSYMFYFCYKFNCDISGWDVAKVKNMIVMFGMCKNFNQDLFQWNVSKVESMYGMFRNCEKFNSNIGNWNVGNVMRVGEMFYNCISFNQDLSHWDTSKVDIKKNMFYNCPIKRGFKPKFKK